MTYEAWRCTYQSSEQAARAAYDTVERLAAEKKILLEALMLIECIYRKNCVNEGEPSSTLEAVQKAIANTTGGRKMTERSDGSTASYYELPPGATQLQDLISHRDMNAQIGEIFRACYRMGLVEHSDRLRDAKKILFYAKAEVERLEKQSTGRGG